MEAQSSSKNIIRTALRDPEFRKIFLADPRGALAAQPQFRHVQLSEKQINAVRAGQSAIQHAGQHCDDAVENWIIRMFEPTNCWPNCVPPDFLAE